LLPQNRVQSQKQYLNGWVHWYFIYGLPQGNSHTPAAEAILQELLRRMASRIIEDLLRKVSWRPNCIIFQKAAVGVSKGWTIAFVLAQGDTMDKLGTEALKCAVLIDSYFPQNGFLVEYYLDRNSGEWITIAESHRTSGRKEHLLWDKSVKAWTVLDAMEYFSLKSRLDAKCPTRKTNGIAARDRPRLDGKC